MFRIGMKESRVFRQKCYSVELGGELAEHHCEGGKERGGAVNNYAMELSEIKTFVIALNS